MENNRRNFLKLTGLADAASLIPLSMFSDEAEDDQQISTRTLIPTETTCLGNQEKENNKNLTVGQNFPNP